MAVFLAYAGLFCWSFPAATVLPLGPELPLALLVRERGVVPWPVMVATAGNFLGSCTTYWLGRRAAVMVAHRPPARGQERAGRLLRRWGSPALLLSWLPVIGDALVLLAGAGALPFGRFALWTVSGKALRYLVIAVLIVRG